VTQDDLAGRLSAVVEGEVRAGEPLAGYTTLRVGGPAAALVRAESPADLAAVAEVCRATGRPWLILGRGSNLLVADDGWPGVVVLLGRGFRGVEVDGTSVTAGGAEPMPSLAQAVAKHCLAGLAFGIAIPGTLGGAVRMNAGAHGSEIRDVLVWAEVARLARGGAVERFGVDDLRMGYRHTALPDDAVVVRARLELVVSEPGRLRDDMAEMRRWRREHQPINEPSCGSVFANPEGDSAGRLIDAAGGKSVRCGKARVSDLHANFITAGPGTTAADVYAVIREVRARVAAEHGVRLRPEVVTAGFPPIEEEDPG
jgi:UDP-N-acetylmuramate dehydrogenase